MDPASSAALIGAAGSLVTSAANAGFTAVKNKKSYKYTKQLADYQTQLNEAMYNKYGSPSAMMQQYTAAGLNPALIAGNGVSVDAPKAGDVGQPSLDAPEFGDFVNSGLAAYQNIRLKDAQVEHMQTQDKLLAEQTEHEKVKTKLDAVRTALTDTENAIKQVELSDAPDKVERLKELHVTEQKLRNAQADLLGEQKNKVIEETKDLSYKNTPEYRKLIEDLKKSENGFNISGIRRNNSSARNTDYDTDFISPVRAQKMVEEMITLHHDQAIKELEKLKYQNEIELGGIEIKLKRNKLSTDQVLSDAFDKYTNFNTPADERLWSQYLLISAGVLEPVAPKLIGLGGLMRK